MASETDQELLHQSHGSVDRGSMDIKDHLKTWHGFLSFIKWLVILNVALLIFLAIFRTHN
jgi:Bacterial aa3 type cytochrome c oxidase subunit IV